MSFSLEIKTLLESIPDCKIEGTSNHSSIIGISSLKNAKDGDLSFLANLQDKSDVKVTNASFVILPINYSDTSKKNKSLSRQINLRTG